MLRALDRTTHPPSQPQSHQRGKPLWMRERNHITDRRDDLRPVLARGRMKRHRNRAVEEIETVPFELGREYLSTVDELPVGDEELPSHPRPRQSKTPRCAQLDQVDFIRGMGAERIDKRLAISRRSRVIETDRGRFYSNAHSACPRAGVAG